MKNVTISANVTENLQAFEGCPSIISLSINEDNDVYHSSGNCIIETATKTLLVGCNGSVIPDDGSVASIWSGAFSGCAELTSIEILDCISAIGSSAFSGCTSLRGITLPASLTTLESGMFADCSSLASVVCC